jgi:SAM-dependent methyltransferase
VRSDRDELWEINAGWWQEGFSAGADPEYEEQIIPMVAERLVGRHRLLDVGTGEGQLARVGAGLGISVVGVDPTWAQTEVAAQRGGGPVYARAEAAALPFADASFDGVLACLVFEHIAAVDQAISEVARVLEPGGRFLFLLNHPLLQTPDSGWIDDTVLEEQYWRIGPYLLESDVIEEVEKNVFIPFVHRPMSRYINAMAANRLHLIEMQEPPPPAGFLAKAADYSMADTIPRLLLLLAEKHG